MTSLIRTLQGCSAIGQTPGHLIGPDEMGDLNAQGATSRFRGTQLLVVRLNKFFIGLGSIGAGSILNALDKRWHPECFVCAGCKHQLANQSFHCKDEVPYCVNCWKEKFQPRCSSCGVIIDPSEQYVLYDDKAYHKGCFRCSQCQTPLNGKQFCIVNGQYLCPEHVQ